MPFIRAKQRKRKSWSRYPEQVYYSVVENFREGGKVRQRTLAEVVPQIWTGS